MPGLIRRLCVVVVLGFCAKLASSESLLPVGVGKASGPLPAILVYHRFAPNATDSMTVRTSSFAAQLEWLNANGYVVIPLRLLVERIAGGSNRLPDKAVVITVDDGHRSVHSQMLPLVRRYRIPVTLFIYPSAISHADYALDWAELEELKQAGFDIQSHSYWHPNFNKEKRRLSPEAYRDWVRTQLVKPRRVLAQKLGITADMLAWPFGIYDNELIAAAAAAGYRAAFTLDRRRPRESDRRLALPRYLITDSLSLREFAQLLSSDRDSGHLHR